MTTTQDRGKSYGNMPTGIPRVLDQHARRLYTSMPGTVVSYDATNRRADVRGSLDVVLADGTQVERPVISNVPVLFPGGANFIFTYPLVVGDSVLLVFSMRGLSRWKLTHGRVAPDVDGLMSERDAMCIPGFGPVGDFDPPVEITADEGSLSMVVKDPNDVANVDAHRRIDLNDTEVKLSFGDDAALVRLSEDAVQFDRGDDHVVLGVGFISINMNGTAQILMSQNTGVTLSAGNNPVNLISTNTVRVNGKTIADAGAGTDSAQGHTHGLTEA